MSQRREREEQMSLEVKLPNTLHIQWNKFWKGHGQVPSKMEMRTDMAHSYCWDSGDKKSKGYEECRILPELIRKPHTLFINMYIGFKLLEKAKQGRD